MRELDVLANLKGGGGKSAARKMDRACKSGAWITIQPIFMDDTDLPD